MKTLFPFLLVLLLPCRFYAQTESYDIITYQPGTNWKKQTTSDHLSYSVSNTKTRSWLQLAIYKSVSSKGDVEKDFSNEWSELVASTYGISQPAQVMPVQNLDGFQSKTGSGSFLFENKPARSQLTTYTNGQVSFSIVINTNTTAYTQIIADFLKSVKINKQLVAQVSQPNSATTVTTPKGVNTTTTNQNSKPTSSIQTGYAFNTTNFDDGWVSSIQEDWVELSKGAVKVLLHFPKGDINYSAATSEVLKSAWTLYAAQRYSNLKNFVAAAPNNDYEGTHFGGGEVMDRAGNSRYVALYHRAGTWWTEIIEPDRKSFIKDFGFDPATVSFKTDAAIFNPLKNFASYNRFAVAATDLQGEWTDHYSSNTFYVNSYTGANAGMSTYTSSSFFRFGAGNQYHHELIAVNFSGGISNAAQAKSDGTFSMLNNWKIRFSSIEGKPANYDVYFSAIKGGRVLFMNDADHPRSGVFKGFSKK